MFTYIIAKLLRLLPNKAIKTPMIPFQNVKMKKDMLIETSVNRTKISLYYPMNTNLKKHPVYINFHGGAFIMNDKDMDDPYCRFLSNETGCVILNVDYAKAPEYPFPKPIQQGYDIIQWLKREADELNFDAGKIMLGGQSSGANLAAALCLYLEEKKDNQPLLQVLSCPMLDFVTSHADKPEPDRWRAQYPQVANFINMCYIPDKEQASHPLASPIHAEVSDRLAPALILVAEYDAFRPEAEFYAEKLKTAGGRVQNMLFKDCCHAFTHLGPKEKAEQAWSLIAREIKETVRKITVSQ